MKYLLLAIILLGYNPLSANADMIDFLPPGAKVEWFSPSNDEDVDYIWACFELQGVRYMIAGNVNKNFMAYVPSCPTQSKKPKVVPLD